MQVCDDGTLISVENDPASNSSTTHWVGDTGNHYETEAKDNGSDSEVQQTTSGTATSSRASTGSKSCATTTPITPVSSKRKNVNSSKSRN